MILNNDQQNRWVNGDVGKIERIDARAKTGLPLLVRLLSGKRVLVERYTWDMIRFTYNGQTERIESQVVGAFTQYPIRLAWAVYHP